MAGSKKTQQGNVFISYNKVISCFSFCYYTLELKIAGKNSKFLSLLCQNPVVLQSFVMDKPEIETIKGKSQLGSGLSELICILN